MATYLHVNNKEYECYDNVDKPYLVVDSKYLPLTTSTGTSNGLNIKLSGQTYVPAMTSIGETTITNTSWSGIEPKYAEGLVEMDGEALTQSMIVKVTRNQSIVSITHVTDGGSIYSKLIIGKNNSYSFDNGDCVDFKGSYAIYNNPQCSSLAPHFYQNTIYSLVNNAYTIKISYGIVKATYPGAYTRYTGYNSILNYYSLGQAITGYDTHYSSEQNGYASESYTVTETAISTVTVAA